MKVREKLSGQVFTVYGVYWHSDKTYFCCFPRLSTGLTSYTEEEVEIFDGLVDADFVFFGSAKKIKGIFHRYLIEHELLDALLEHDSQAYKRFVSLLGREP